MSIRYLSGIEVDANTLFVDSANDRVGIGTASPGAILTIKGTTNGYGSGIRWDNVSTANNFEAIHGSSDTLYWGYNGTTFLQMVGSSNLNFVGSGNVGIGTTSPGARLEVQGDGSSVDIFRVRYNALYYTDYSSNKLNFTGSSQTYQIQNNGSAAITINSSSNVGIGTTSPTQKLSVAGNIALVSNNSFISFNTSASSGDPKIQMGSDGDFSFVNTAGSTNLHIENGGNVGIGTTSPAQKLDVRGFVVSNSQSNGSESAFYLGNSSHGLSRANLQNDIVLYTTAGDVKISANTASNTHLIVKNNGNVGIGTTSPSGKLHIQTDASSEFIFTGASTSGYATTFHMDNTGLDIGHNSTGRALNLKTGSLDRLTILGNGKVGIGTTSPSEKLEVIGTLRLHDGVDNGRILFRGDRTDVYIQELSYGLLFGAPSGLFFEVDTNNNGQGIFNITRQGSSSFYINDSQNVGIGTTAPLAKLQVTGANDNTYGQLMVTSTGSGADAQITFGTPLNGRGMYVDDSDNNKLKFYTGAGKGVAGTEVTFDNAGNVGIGTTSPSTLLELYNTNASFPNTTGTAQSSGHRLRLGRTDGAVLDIGSAGGDGLWLQSTNGTNLALTYPILLNPNGGNVSIGTTLTDNLISGTERALRVASSNVASLYLESTGAGTWATYVNTARSIVWYDITADAERMRITSAGNVGIGTTAPSNLLHVAGQPRFDSVGGAPVDTSAPVTQDKYYGYNSVVLTDPDTWLKISISGTDYVIPAYAG